MKRILLYLSIILLISCSVASNTDRDRAILATSYNEAVQITEELTNHYFDTTYTKNNQTFRISTKDLSEEFVLLIASHNSKPALIDTINSGGLADMEFPDFNKDGYIDIMLTYMGNNSINLLYLFDPISSMFKNVEGFDRYPEATQLKTPEMYYSYQRAGCADMNWISNLFKIENFKTIKLGQIQGIGCESEEAHQVVEIYKIQNQNEEKRELVEKHSYVEIIPEHADKWAFIETYWNNKFNKFN